MIFTEAHARQVLDHSKWQTRRPVRPDEMLVYATSAKSGAMFSHVQDERFSIPTVIIFRAGHPVWEDDFVRVKWQVGRNYAIQTGRGKKAMGRTPPIEAIRRERLQEINDDDCRAEGIQYKFNQLENAFRAYNIIDPAPYHIAYHAFRALWGHIYRKPYDWASNPEVWVLIFEREGER